MTKPKKLLEQAMTKYYCDITAVEQKIPMFIGLKNTSTTLIKNIR